MFYLLICCGDRQVLDAYLGVKLDDIVVECNKMIFEPKTGGVDNLFARLSEDPVFAEQRAVIERLWTAYAPYADHNFLVDLPHQFFPRFWEIYLGSALLHAGFQCVPRTKRPAAGPDFCLPRGGSSIWIEATAPTGGNGQDAVLPLELGGGWVPADQIVLRFRSRIEEKFRQYGNYLQDRIVSPDEPFVIALNGAQVPHADAAFPDDIPYPIQAVLPFGPYSVYVDRETLEVVSEGFAHRPQIVKRSGAPVATNIFLDETYAGISGILFSNIHPYWIKGNTLQVMSYIHNPCGYNKLPQGWLGSGREWWLERDILKTRSLPSGA